MSTTNGHPGARLRDELADLAERVRFAAHAFGAESEPAKALRDAAEMLDSDAAREARAAARHADYMRVLRHLDQINDLLSDQLTRVTGERDTLRAALTRRPV
jgi:hypothetical protein